MQGHMGTSDSDSIRLCSSGRGQNNIINCVLLLPEVYCLLVHYYSHMGQVGPGWSQNRYNII